MSAFEGGRDDMLTRELTSAEWEWLARVAEIDGSAWIEAPEPISQRRVGRYVTAAVGIVSIFVLTFTALVAL